METCELATFVPSTLRYKSKFQGTVNVCPAVPTCALNCVMPATAPGARIRDAIQVLLANVAKPAAHVAPTKARPGKEAAAPKKPPTPRKKA